MGANVKKRCNRIVTKSSSGFSKSADSRLSVRCSTRCATLALDAAVSRQGVRDEAESSEAEIQDDIEFALLQMKAETLKKIGKALSCLEAGSLATVTSVAPRFLSSVSGLSPLPFVARAARRRVRSSVSGSAYLASRRSSASLFADMIGG